MNQKKKLLDSLTCILYVVSRLHVVVVNVKGIINHCDTVNSATRALFNAS